MQYLSRHQDMISKDQILLNDVNETGQQPKPNLDEMILEAPAR